MRRKFKVKKRPPLNPDTCQGVGKAGALQACVRFEGRGRWGVAEIRDALATAIGTS